MKRYVLAIVLLLPFMNGHSPIEQTHGIYQTTAPFELAGVNRGQDGKDVKT